MANEFRHVSVGTELSQTEYEAIGGHLFESQATGDTLYASSATQLSRLGIGSANQILQVSGGIPAWTSTLSPTTIELGHASDTTLARSAAGVVTIEGSEIVTENSATVAFQQATTISTSSGILTLTPGTDVHITDAHGLVIGHTAQIAQGGVTGEVQILGTAQADANLQLARFTADGSGPEIRMGKSRGATIASYTIVQNTDIVSTIFGHAADGVDLVQYVGSIQLGVEDASPAADAIGGYVAIWTSTTAGVKAEKWRVNPVGVLTSLGAGAANVSAVGAIIASGGIAMTDVLAAWIDDATHGAGTTTHYIGNQTITTSSDKRVKTGIRPWDGDALALLDKARLVEFSYNLPGGGPQDSGYGPNARGRYVGMLAQETIEWAPWIINAGAGKGCPDCEAGRECPQGHALWHVEYDHLVPVLVRALQQANERLAALEAATHMEG